MYFGFSKVVCFPLDHIQQGNKGSCGRSVPYPFGNGVSRVQTYFGISER